MSEGVLAILAKYLWGVISAVFGALFWWMFSRQNNTYTKEEADRVMDYKLSNFIVKLDHHSDVQEKLALAIEKQTSLYTNIREDSIRMEGKLEGLHSSIEDIKKSIEQGRD